MQRSYLGESGGRAANDCHVTRGTPREQRSYSEICLDFATGVQTLCMIVSLSYMIARVTRDVTHAM